MASSRPWTIDDFRKNAATWSLEGDAKLLEFMQTISQNLEKRVITTKTNLNRLMFDLQYTSIALDNATNKLASLQYSQFVENRVSEDDEPISNKKDTSTKEDTKDIKPYNPVELLKTIMKNSVTVLDECYEKVSINLEDSDEDEEESSSKSIIYRPKNPFDQRPLPHIIGTKEWREKWHIGLCDSEEDFSEEENGDQFSDSSDNASLTVSLPSNAPTVSESEISTWGLQTNTGPRNIKFTNLSDDEISSNTATSKNSSVDSKNTMSGNIPPVVLPIPDQRYYIHKPKYKGLFDDSSDESDGGTFKNNTTQQKLVTEKSDFNRISNIISDEPPDLNEVNHKDKDNQQYFIENDEENYQKTSEKRIKPKEDVSLKNKDDNQLSNVHKKTVNLFDDDDFNSFMKELDKKTIEQVSKTNIDVKPKNLFDEESDGEDKIFSFTKATRKESAQVFEKTEDIIPPSQLSSNTKTNTFEAKSCNTKILNLFDDEAQEDDFDRIFGYKDKTTGKEKLKLPDNQVIDKDLGIAEQQNPKTCDNLSEKNKHLSSLFSKEPSSDTFNIKNGPFDNQNKNNTDSDNKINKFKLFDDDLSDEDLFGSGVQNIQKISTESSKKPENSKNLFDNNQEGNNLFEDNNMTDTSIENLSKLSESKENSKSVEVNKASNIFFDDDLSEQDDLFSVTIRKPSTSNVKTLNSSVKDTSKELKKSTQINSLFLDGPLGNDEGDIFSLPKKSISIFDEVKDKINMIKDNVTTTSQYSENNEQIKERSDNNSKGLINSKISTLMNLFSDDPPSDSDNSFGFKADETPKSLNESDSVADKKNSGATENVDSFIENSNVNLSIAETNETNSHDSEKNQSKEWFSTESLSPPIGDSFMPNSNDKLENEINGAVVVEQMLNKEGNKYWEFEKNTNVRELKDDESSSVNKIDARISKKEEHMKPVINNEHDSPDFVRDKLPSVNDNGSIFSSDNMCEEKSTIYKNSTDILNNSKNITFQSNHNVLDYNPIGLFQDIPPEDDFQIPSEQKRSHNIFYDDFSETIIPSENSSTRITSSNYIFSDEPPPDIFETADDQTEKETLSTKEKDNELETNLNIQKVNSADAKSIDFESNMNDQNKRQSSVAELAKKVNALSNSEPVKSSVTLPPPKKLNLNLNINVAALRPDAKRPNIIERSDKSVEGNFDGIANLPAINSGNFSAGDTGSKLIHPNKSRAKIQVKRRPSTRKGREESYRKSLTLDGNISDSNNSGEESLFKENSGTVNSNQEVRIRSKKNVFSSNVISKLDDNKITKVATNLPSTNLFSEVSRNILFEEKTSSQSINESNSSRLDSPLFFDDQVPLPSTKSEITILSDERDVKFIQSQNVEKMAKSQTFNEDIQTANIGVVKTVLSTSSKSTDEVKSLNSDEDDLFAPKVLPTKLTNPPQKLTKVSSPVKPIIESKSIFQDDSDDDDLFGKSQTKVKAKEQKSTSIASKKREFIFSSDEDDNDLFGEKTNTKIGQIEKSKITPSTSGNLFCDVEGDDDDDLFGGSSKNSKTTVKPRPAVVTKKTENKVALSGKTLNDNPLSDLLND